MAKSFVCKKRPREAVMDNTTAHLRKSSPLNMRLVSEADLRSRPLKDSYVSSGDFFSAQPTEESRRRQ